MKIQHLLSGALLLITQALLSQDVNLTGTVLCPDGTQFNSNGINYIFMTQDSSVCCIDSVGIPLDANGNFNYTFDGGQNGIVTLWFADYSGNYIGVSGLYYPGNTALVFTLDACEPEEEPCMVDISFEADSVLNEEAYVFLNSYTNISDPVYSWSFGDGGSSTAANPVYEYNETGTYTVCVTVTGGGCTATDCIEITVDENGNGQEGGGMMVQGFTLVVNGGISSTSEMTMTEISVYPNPLSSAQALYMNSAQAMRGELTLHAASGARIESRQVYVGVGTTELPLNFQNLTPGIYIMQFIEPNGKTHQFKLII